MKYKQKVIPEILTCCKTFKNLTRKQLNLFCEAYYLKNITGKSIINKHLGLKIEFTNKGAKKISKGSALYPYKAIVLLKFLELLEHAEYNNFGQPKETDTKDLRGYLNFKGKIKIDGKIENYRIAVKLYKDNKAFYNHERIIKKP